MAKQVAYQNWSVGASVGVEDYDVNQVFQAADGFDAYGLISPSGDPPVLVIRGTQLSLDGIDDILDDANTNGIGYKQFIDNRAAVEAWLSAVSANGQRPDITGHSLGGALAQWFAVDYTQTPGALLGRVVTFNSPGISADYAARFNPNDALGVMHYIDSGDIVSLAGQAYIAGQYTLCSYVETDLNPIDYVMDKHCLPLVAASYEDTSGKTWTQPANLQCTTYSTVDWLNNPWFAYIDAQSMEFDAAMNAAAVAIDPSLLGLTTQLLFRGTVENIRTEIGGALNELASGMDIGTSPNGTSISFPNVTLDLPGEVNLSATELSVQYTTSPQPSLEIQGSASIGALFGVSAMADFAGSNYIEITDHDIEVVGQVSVSDLTIDGWGLKQVALSIDTGTGAVSGSATITIPPGLDFEGGLSFVNGKLNDVSIEAGDSQGPLNVPIGDTGAFLQTISGEVDHWSDGQPISFTGSAEFTYGPEVDIALPSWLGLGDEISGSLVDAQLTVTIEKNHLYGNGTITIAGGLATMTGSADLNWDQGHVSLDGQTSFLGGLVTTDESFVGDTNANLTAKGTATVTIPSTILGLTIPGGGTKLASGSFYFQFCNDGDKGDDYVEGWGTLDLGSLGNEEIGFIERFDGSGPQLIGASQIPDPSHTFPVESSGVPWLMLSANWDNAASNVPVEIQEPDGTVLAEANFDGVTVGLLPGFSTSTQEVVWITNPDAGNWMIIVPDAIGLGNVTFSALAGVPLATPDVAITSPAADVQGGSVSIGYSIAGASANSELNLFYDDSGAGYQGVMIDHFVANNGTGTYTWNTANVPTGEYYLYATLMNNDGVPATSNYSVGRVSVVDPASPPQVTGLSAPEGDALSVRLIWDASQATDLDHYLVRWTDNAAGEDYDQVSATTQPFITLSGLITGETYRVAVAAVDTDGHIGPDSQPIVVVVGGQATVPPAAGQWSVFAQPGSVYQAQVPENPGDTLTLIDAPTGATLTSSGVFQWNVPTAADGWQQVSVLGTAPAGDTTVYRYYLFADGSSPVLPAVPLQSQAVDPYSVSVTAPDGLDACGVLRYQIERDGVIVGGWQTSPVFLDTGLQPNSVYTYCVQAEDSFPQALTSPWSDSVSVQTPAATPNAPVLGNATATSVEAHFIGPGRESGRY